MSEQPNPSTNPEYAVILPVERDRFSEFIARLLGKVQRIDRSFEGTFDLSPDEIDNTFHLVDQRVTRQQKASLIQFTVNVMYNDGSSILLGSLNEFKSYAEVRPIVSRAVELSWIYLIDFPGRTVPEKQEIGLGFHASGRAYIVGNPSISLPVRYVDSGMVSLTINYTERTWGVDIESLISGHVQSLFKNIHPVRKFLYEYSGWIGSVSASIFFGISLLGAYHASSNFLSTKLLESATILDNSSPNMEGVQAHLQYLVEESARGDWAKFFFALAWFVIISLILSVLFGVWVGSNADNRPASFVRLSKAAEERKEKLTEKQRRRWYMLGLSYVTAISASVLGAIIFDFIAGR
ncbi:MAG: hypothetical protein OXC18_13135 [Desulfurellaceae bacterium]|nr:hypothetical protein [Desulfurellaceae bacterium]